MWPRLYLFLAGLFLVHGLIFARLWLRRRQWRHLCLVGTFSALTLIYALKYAGLIGPCSLSLSPEMALRAAAVAFSGAAVVGYILGRKQD